MDYNHIKDYLVKFKEILFNKEEDLSIISKIIEKNTGVSLDIKNIKTKNSEIFIKTSPIIRGEILMKKDKILSDLLVLKPVNKFKNIK